MPLRRWTMLIVAPALLLLSSYGLADEAAPKPEVDPAHVEKMQAGLALFKSKVRNVLIDQCVDCHGGAEVESGLDLATRKGLLRGGSKGPAVVAGKAIDSQLVRLVTHREKPFMPAESDKLSEEALAAISEWIELGAPYDRPLVENPRDPDSWVDNRIPANARDFWAFRPLHVVAPPALADAADMAWVKTPLDAFVLAKQKEKGLTPNPTADRGVLIRRAYFDLIGLPPTAVEVQAFVADSDPEAYSKLIDRLLENPHFGERWGRHWLDTARFAESHGFEQDYDRPFAYHYRDFVIKAFNSDLPYDQFVRWQLAGDEFEPDNPLAMMATGFLGAGVFPTQITANEVERTRYDALDDMAATTSSALLGLSVGCARCHDHKFDPIPQADYYRFAATFTTTVRGNIDLNLKPAEYAAAKAAFDVEHQPLVAARTKYEAEQLPAKFCAWEQSPASIALKQAAWRTVEPFESKSAGGATFRKLPDGSLLVEGANADFDTYTFSVKTPLRRLTGVRLEPLADASLVAGGPGRASNGNIALTDFVVTAAPLTGGDAQRATLQSPQATFEQPGLAVAFAFDGDAKSAWALDPQFGKDHAAAFEFAQPIDHESGTLLTLTLKFENNKQHNIGRLRISLTSATAPLPLVGAGIDAAAGDALQTAAEQRSPEQLATLLRWFGPQDDGWRQLNGAVEAHAAKAPKPETTQVMVMSEGITPIRHHTQGGDFLNETHYLKRGDCDQKQGVAPAGFLQVMTASGANSWRWQDAPPAGAKVSYRRRALANWMTDFDQGAGQLLARVIVNRLWQHHFGVGIVATPNDFGVQGTPPTHPELLDYLATKLIADGWRLKPLHKLLMTSSVYQQSSAFDETDTKLDPDNTWLWRRQPQRLEAEIIRDNILATSCALDNTMYGPGTLDANQKRRSIYFTIKRSQLVPAMQLFDQPEPLVSVGSRPATTIAPQALLFMNNASVRQCAHSFAAKLAPAAEKSIEEAVSAGYCTAIGRPPDAEELAASTQFIAEQQASYTAANKPNARELALTDFCQVLFGLNGFVYVE